MKQKRCAELRYIYFITILKHIKLPGIMITHRASEFVYCTTKRR